jgi:hypothetical protein
MDAEFTGGCKAALERFAGRVDDTIEVVLTRLEMVEFDLHRYQRIGHREVLALHMVKRGIRRDLEDQFAGLDRTRPEDRRRLSDIAGGDSIRKRSRARRTLRPRLR